MPLTQANITINQQWTLSKATSGFGDVSEGPDSQSFNLTGLSLSGTNQGYNVQIALNSGAVSTVDLCSGTNLVGENFTFTRARTVMVQASGAAIAVQPGAAQGMQWFWGGGSGSSVIVPPQGCFAFSEGVATSGQPVSSGSRTISFINCSGGSGTVKLSAFGGTV